MVLKLTPDTALISDIIGRYPRWRLSQTPSPIERMRRLEEDLGTDVEIYFKREDLLRSLCGNKIRYLEYVLGAYDQEAANCLVHCGGQTSNYMAQLAIVGAAEGIPVHLILLGEQPDEPNGNPLIEDLLGAHIYYRAGKFGGSCSDHKAALAETLREEGQRPYVIDYPFSNYSAILGYMTAYIEMRAQIERGEAPEFDHLFLCSGSNSFLGLRLAASLAGDTTPITAIPPITWKETGLGHIAPDLDTFARKKIQEFSDWIEQDLPITTLDFDERHVGPGYGIPTKASIDAVRRVGRCEGILLDPIYTGKAMAGLMKRIKNHEFEPGSRLLFFQSGGPVNSLGYFREFAQEPAT